MAQYIDTRDLAAELDELEQRDASTDDTTEDGEPLTEEERARLLALQDLADEIGSEFYHGETMIPVEDFEDYAEQLADELGYMDDTRANDWPFRHIDWKAAAEELAQDYTEVEWEGTSYYVRAS